jgi:hypothetical protein
VETVYIYGDNYYSAEDVRYVSGIDGANWLTLDTKSAENNLRRRLWWVESATVRRGFFGKAKITLFMQKPAAIVTADGKRCLLSETGRLISGVPEDSELPVMEFVGFDFKKLNYGENISTIAKKKNADTRYALVSEITPILRRSNFDVTLADITDYFNIKLTSGNLVIEVGKPTELSEKLSAAYKIAVMYHQGEKGRILIKSLNTAVFVPDNTEPEAAPDNTPDTPDTPETTADSTQTTAEGTQTATEGTWITKTAQNEPDIADIAE